MKYFWFILIVVIGFSSCAPTRYVKPLKEDQIAINGSFGGPLINVFGASIPIPLTSVGVGYGVSEKVTGYVSLQTTTLFYGVVHLDGGLNLNILKTDSMNRLIPGISAGVGLNAIYNLWDKGFKVFPMLDVNAYWDYSRKKENFAYIGLNNWIDMSTTRVHRVPQENHWIFSPAIGHVFANEKWDFTTEFKWLAPSYSNQKLVVDYVKPTGTKGAMGIYLGLNRKF